MKSVTTKVEASNSDRPPSPTETSALTPTTCASSSPTMGSGQPSTSEGPSSRLEHGKWSEIPPSTSPSSIRPADKATSSNVSIIVNPMDVTIETSDNREDGRTSDLSSPVGTESPGTSQMSPPPSYQDIPGTVPALQGVSRGPPPSYEDAVDPNAEPPSYNSLFGRIRDTHKASRNFVDFLVKLFLLLIGTIGCTIFYSICIVIPICMIVIGSIYFDECPVEPYIPVFLIVGGSFSLFKYLVGVANRIRMVDSDDEHQSHPAQSLITCFLCGWFITGCVWVYRVYKPDMDISFRGSSNYCNETVYVFAFWLITTAYIFLGLFTSCICCFNVITLMQ